MTSSPTDLASETKKANEAWGQLVKAAGIEKQ